jgi:single-stranded DNA-binding protein
MPNLNKVTLIGNLIGDYCKKGRPLFVEGRLKLDTWDDKTSGQKRTKMKVVVENMQAPLTGRKRPSKSRTLSM